MQDGRLNTSFCPSWRLIGCGCGEMPCAHHVACQQKSRSPKSARVGRHLRQARAQALPSDAGHIQREMLAVMAARYAGQGCSRARLLAGRHLGRLHGQVSSTALDTVRG
jgi:hypothetical protein